jgi:hypothetical protein
MKTKRVERSWKIVLCGMVAWLLSSSIQAQPDYDFRNPILISGTDRQPGAVYRFNNVKTGVDAFVTLTFLTPGITVSALDDGSGYPEALQPTLVVSPFTNGYLEMQIDFLFAGTNTPYVQTKVPVTCIDVDGISNYDGAGRGVFEFDEVDLGGGYVNYNLLGNELQMSQSGNVFRGYNTGGIDYPGRDTSARQVMFTVVNYNIGSARIRVGVDNKASISATRLRSVYFKEFYYPNAVMPLFGLLGFTGIAQENQNQLNWELAAECSFTGVSIEKSSDGKKFASIASMPVIFSNNKQKMQYADMQVSGARTYYRLRFSHQDGSIQYSDVLMLAGKSPASAGFKIYPNIVEAAATVSVYQDRNTAAEITLVDMGGKVLNRQSVQLQKGQNAIQITGLEKTAKGMYVVCLSTSEERMVQRIIRK